MDQNITDEIIRLCRSIHTRRHYHQYFKNLRSFLYHIKEKTILAYSGEELKQLILWLDQQKWSRIEKHKHMIALKKWVQKAQEPYLLQGYPLPNTINYALIFDYKRILIRDFQDTPKWIMKRNYLTKESWLELITRVKEISPYDYIMFRMFESGCRVGGLIALLKKDINLEIGYFDSVEKTGKVRYFLPDTLLDELKWYITRTKLDKLISVESGVGIRYRMAKYTHIKPHDLRRSIMRLFDQAGASESDLCLLSNHKPSMNALYARVDPWVDPEAAKQRYQLFWNKVFL